jgi:hypothetical protein
MAIVMELSSTKTMLSIHLSSVKHKVLLKERDKGGTEENRTIGEIAAEMHNGLKAKITRTATAVRSLGARAFDV